MPKKITTALGPAEIHSSSYATKKARVQILFLSPGQPKTLQKVQAERVSSANEPNTWVWSVHGVKNWPVAQVLSPDSRTAIQSYLSYCI